MIKKAVLLSATAILASVVAQAGQIQIGQVINNVNYGLTKTYVPTHTAVNLVTYQPVLFQSASNSPAITYPIATSTAALNVSDPTNAGGATFALIGDPTVSGGGTWYSTNTAGTSTVTIPVGVFGVGTVWTMLNDYNGSAVTATFYFNGTNTTTGATQVAVNLVDGQTIRSAVLCSNGCAAGSSQSLVASNTVAATNVPGGNITVSTGSINYPNGTPWHPAYTSILAGQPDAASTAGNLTLDDQAFQFGSTFANQYLVQVVFTEANTQPSNPLAHFTLTALTVDTLGNTPEPSTLVLGALCLGLAGGFKRFRKTRQSKLS